MRTRGSFVHRHNPNHTYDSICTRCIATVACQQQKEEDLAALEAAHVCDARLLEARQRWLRAWNSSHDLPSDPQER